LDLTDNILVWALLLVSLVLSALCTIMIKGLIKAAIALAIASAVLTAVMFLMGAVLAAVLELSVCAGLITAVFISTISMTTPETGEEQEAQSRNWIKRVIYLPIILAAAGVGIALLKPSIEIPKAAALSWQEITAQLWASPLTIFGLILVVLAGVFGVVVLFRRKAVKK
jgi:NADH-quinone oxidoreductase subunit J